MSKPPASPAPGSGRGVVFAVGMVWCATLGALVFTSSNPVVVNRTQILSSMVIAIGTRDPQKPNDLVVERIWQGIKPGARITVRDWPAVCPNGEIVVPLMRHGEQGFRVTQGQLPNPALKANQLPETALVQPLVYPATKEVLDQLSSLVGPADAR